MPRISVPIPGVDPDSRAQLEYALTFASEDLLSYQINVANSTIEAEVSSEAACDRASRKIEELVERYQKREFGLPSTSSLDKNVNCRRLTLGLGCWSEDG